MELSQMREVIKGLSKEEMLTALGLLQEAIDSHLEQTETEPETEAEVPAVVLSPEVEQRIQTLVAQRTGQPAPVSWQHVASLAGAVLVGLACFFLGRYNDKLAPKKKK